MALLRSPERGCPWDLRQTHQSLRPYLIEETYEAIDAIDRGDLEGLAGELGDVLLQCAFHAQIGAEHGRFDMADVAASISDKLVRRHPHVFRSDGRPLSPAARRKAGITTPGAVKEQWAAIKALEQTAAGQAPRLLAGLPRALPALVRAQKIGTRVAAVGFDWTSADAVFEKIDEELDELRRARAEGLDRTREELGDLLFAVVNLARKLGLDPEHALGAANDKFTRRFEALEAIFERSGRDLHRASTGDLEDAWQAAKKATAAGAEPPATSASTRPRPARRARRPRS